MDRTAGYPGDPKPRAMDRYPDDSSPAEPFIPGEWSRRRAWFGVRKKDINHHLAAQLFAIIAHYYPKYDPVLAMIHLAHGRGPDGEALMEYGLPGPNGTVAVRPALVPPELQYACHREVAQYIRPRVAGKLRLEDDGSSPVVESNAIDLTRLTDEQLVALDRAYVGEDVDT